MVEYWLAYFQLGDSGLYRFECVDPSSIPVGSPQNQLLVGDAELKDVYLTWHHWFVEGTQVHLATFTHTELSVHQVKDLVLEALKFAQEHCEQDTLSPGLSHPPELLE